MSRGNPLSPTTTTHTHTDALHPRSKTRKEIKRSIPALCAQAAHQSRTLAASVCANVPRPKTIALNAYSTGSGGHKSGRKCGGGKRGRTCTRVHPDYGTVVQSGDIGVFIGASHTVRAF